MKQIFFLFTTILAFLLTTPAHAQSGSVSTTTPATIQGSKGKLSALIVKPATKEGQKIDVAIVMHGFTGNKVLREEAIRGNTMGATYDPLDPPEKVKMFNGLYLGEMVAEYLNSQNK